MILHNLLCLLISFLIHLYLIEFHHDKTIFHVFLSATSICWHLLLACEYHVWCRLVKLVLVLIASVRVERWSVLLLAWLNVGVLIAFAYTSYHASLVWSLGRLPSILVGSKTSDAVIAWLEGIWSALSIKESSWIVAADETGWLLLMLGLPVEGCRRYFVVFVLLKLVLFWKLLLVDNVFYVLCYFYGIWDWRYPYLRVATANVWSLWALLQHRLGLRQSTSGTRLQLGMLLAQTNILLLHIRTILSSLRCTRLANQIICETHSSWLHCA